VIEWLMLNHPHDCPVCDEGGECHLQDMTVMTGHAYRESRYEKRTHINQDLGPLVNHEMNRCIQCYRCVRYYRDYAGGRDFNVFASHDHVYFGRCGDGALESEFSGNLVEICPTGVFTDKTFRKRFSRKWDLQTAPSVCVHCSLGCNTIPGSRYGELRRVRNRYNREVNGYFLCDRGRYGYEFVNSSLRIREPLVRAPKGSEPAAVTVEEALKHAAACLTDSRRAIGIGSPRASLESNFALMAMVGRENFFAGVADEDLELLRLVLAVLGNCPNRPPSLNETLNADAVLVLGEDVCNMAPMLALNLRQLAHRKAARFLESMKVPCWMDAPISRIALDEKAMLYIATPYGTRLDDVALRTHHAPPGDLARLGFGIASMLNQSAPAVANLSEEERLLADEIARSLKAAARPLIVSGVGCRSRAVIEAAANVCCALNENGQRAEIFLTLPEANSLGLAMLGVSGGIETAAGVMRNGGAETLIILENNLYRRAQSTLVTELLFSAKHVIAIDHLLHDTTSKADIVLPAAVFTESSGSLVNNEGRAQRFFGVIRPESQVRESWRWSCDMMKAAGRREAADWRTLDDLVEAIAAAVPALSALPSAAPGAHFRLTGGKVPRQSHRYSGRTAIRAQVDVNEQKPPEDADTPLVFSMEGDDRQPPSTLIPRFWAPGWNSAQSLNKFQEEIGGPLRGGDPGIRLIEPDPQSKATYFEDIPARRPPDEGRRLFLPIHHIFGSEELSALAPGIAGLSPQPYVALHPEDASKLGLAENDTAKVALDGSVLKLSVRILPSLPRGTAGLPVGLPGELFMDLPASGEISKEGSDG